MNRRVLGNHGVNFYHVVSRVVDRRIVFGAEEKWFFRRLMRRLLQFSGIRCVTFCLMGNHFHLVLEVPDAEGEAFKANASIDEILERLGAIYDEERVAEIRKDCEREEKRKGGGAREMLEPYVDRMYSLSTFLKELKHAFSCWFNRRNDRCGTLWESRFKSILVEGLGDVLRVICAYVDLNPVRAGIAADPKDYPWSGYGAAVAGDIESRKGLSRMHGFMVPERQRKDFAWGAFQAEYRMFLFGKAAVASGDSREMTLDAKAIQKVLDSGGRLTLSEVLLCRVRYFTNGFAVGTSPFLQGVFEAQRDHFSPSRKQGDVFMKGADWGELRAMRNLQVAPVGTGGEEDG